MTRIQRNKLLEPIRLTIHGWAFAPDDWLPRMIERAEKMKYDLPDELLPEACQLIEPLKRSLIHD